MQSIVETRFGLMVAAIVTASLIMVVGMVPLSELISKSRHFSVTMLVGRKAAPVHPV